MTQQHLAQRFAARFRGLDRAHGVYQVGAASVRKGNKVAGRAKTVKELVVEQTWLDHLAGRTGLGIVPINDDSECGFGAIDVDVYNLDLAELEKKIAELGFPLVLCRTKSGGAHLYVFCSDPVPAHVLRSSLMRWATQLGYPKSEIFPKQDQMTEEDVGSWINLPYFDAAKTQRYAILDGKPLGLSQFLDHCDAKVIDAKLLEDAATERAGDRLAGGPPCLQYLARVGFPEGTRNKGLFNLGVYCRARYGDDGWKENLDQLNQELMLPPLSSNEVQTIAKSVGRKKYSYTCKDDPIASVCNRSICLKQPYGVGNHDGDPGVSIDNLTKVLTDPPKWNVTVDGKIIKLPTTEHLIRQAWFIVACVEQANIMPQQVSNATWCELVKNLLEKVEEQEAACDAGVSGQLLDTLYEFCAEAANATGREDLLIGRAWREDNIVMFKSQDFLAYADKRKVKVPARDAWTIFHKHNVESRVIRIKNQTVRCWCVELPVENREPLSVPKIGEEEQF